MTLFKSLVCQPYLAKEESKLPCFHDKIHFNITRSLCSFSLKAHLFSTSPNSQDTPLPFAMPLHSPSLKALQVVIAELRQLFKLGMGTPSMLSASQIQKKEINPALRSLLADASMTPCHLNLQEASQIDTLPINISAAEELCMVQLP